MLSATIDFYANKIVLLALDPAILNLAFPLDTSAVNVARSEVPVLTTLSDIVASVPALLTN